MTHPGLPARRAIQLLAAGLMLALAIAYSGFSTRTASVEAAGASYYVDSVGGNDNNSGTSESSAWKSLSKVNGRSFSAGDTVYFKRGSSFSGNLTIRSSGASGNPITFKAYGTGNAPVVSYPNVQWGHSIDVYGSYVVVQDFLARDAHEAGVSVQSGASNVVVQNNEITSTGQGIIVSGANARISGNHIHDLRMMVDTEGGDDDYGAIGVFVNGASGTEISNNRFVNCRASSHDYGSDGGAVEIWGNVSNLNVHHNYSSGTNGFAELGRGSAKDVTFANNTSEGDYQGFVTFHVSGPFASSVSNFRIENNTISNPVGSYRLIDSGWDAPPSSLIMSNNVIR